MIVIDASVMIEVLLGTSSGRTLGARLLRGVDPLCAPHLLDVEVCLVLRRYVLKDEMDDRRAREAIADLSSFPIERYPHEILLRRVWELRTNLTAYDGVYVALAEALNATLITRDARLAEAPGLRAVIELA